MDKHLNIVAFDNPYPPNYGGVIDVYYKIKSLSEIGLKIHLHFFTKNKIEDKILGQFCEEVFIYKRKIGLTKQFSLNPYIVETRDSKELKLNLNKNNYPILFEGLHTTKLILEEASILNRSIIRHHNIEHDYYLGLFKSTNNLISKLYYLIESKKLKSYLPKVKNAKANIAISDADSIQLSELGFKDIITIPPFHSTEGTSIINKKTEENPYVLYHGNLKVDENLVAVNYLIKEVFTDPNVNFVIAGSCNDSNLIRGLKDNIKTILNPSFEKIAELIANAKVIALPTFQSTGVKLKLIESLYKGQHVIVNEAMIEGFPLPELTSVAKDSEEMRKLISENLNKNFTIEDRSNRIQKMNLHFSNEQNARRIEEILDKLLR